MARQRNPNALDNRSNEWTTAFLIPCDLQQHYVFLSKRSWFILYHTWVRCMWHFESQERSICITFCDAIPVPLSLNTGQKCH